ncbi:MAG: branched-chain amino acid ABC transporter permease [Acidimicrobiales bacterium]|jgi:branched-chain amino acid transport system permease protein
MDGFLTSRNVTDVLEGIVQGVVVGLVALGLVLIWRATRVLNFALGAIATFAAYLGMGLLSYHVGFWWCFVLCIPFGMVLGGVAERVFVRPLYGKPELNPIVATVGLLLLIEAVVGAIWSTTTRAIPVPFSFIRWTLDGNPFALSPLSVFQISAALVLALAIGALFRFTNLGLQLRATAHAPEVSRLLGVRVGRMLTLGWMLSCSVGAVAAVIVASGFATGLTPSEMEAPFAVGFIAAAVGGLDNPIGALFAGIAFGVIEQFVTDYLNANLVLPVALGVLILVLVLRPQGVFSRQVARRV